MSDHFDWIAMMDAQNSGLPNVPEDPATVLQAGMFGRGGKDDTRNMFVGGGSGGGYSGGRPASAFIQTPKSLPVIKGESPRQLSIEPVFKQTAKSMDDYKIPHDKLLKGGAEFARGRGVETTVPIKDISASQAGVKTNYKQVAAKNARENPNFLPQIYKYNGEYYLRDGHHRISAAAVEGNPTIKASVVDLTHLGIAGILALGGGAALTPDSSNIK